jgi:hypothetical protein
VDRNIFQQATGAERIIFVEDDRGAVRSALLSLVPILTFTRPSFADQPLLTESILAVALLLLLSGLILPPTGVLALIFRKLRSQGAARTAALVGLALVAAYIAYFVILFAAFSGSPLEIIASSPGKKFAPFVPLLGLALSVAGAFFAVRAWRGRFWSLFSRVHFAALVIATLALFWLLAHWKAVA